jgi:hypothetical protein
MSIRLHTPGPWTVDYTDDNLRIYAGDLLICQVNGSTEHIEVHGLDEERPRRRMPSGMTLNQRVQGLSPCAPTKKSQETNSLRCSSKERGSCIILCPTHVRKAGSRGESTSGLFYGLAGHRLAGSLLGRTGHDGVAGMT